MKQLLSLVFTFVLCLGSWANESWRVYDMTCEQLHEPVGIDIATPAFSWKLRSGERGAMQSAYQILVSTSEALLDEQGADVWNSGKVESDRSVQVQFEGKPLASATTYWWKVRSWNANGEASEWSAPSRFTTGLMGEKDWDKAKWIAMEKDKELVVPALHQPEVRQKLGDKEVGKYTMPQFRKVVPVKKQVEQALLYVCGLGHFDFFLNGEKVGNHFLDPGWTKYDKEALYVAFDVTDQLRQGDNVLGVMLGNGFYNIPRERYYKLLGTFGAPKMRMRLVIRYADGKEASVVSDKSWRVTSSPITFSSIFGGEDYDATLEQEGWKSDAAFDDSRWQKALEVEQPISLKAQTGTHLTVRDVLPAQTFYKNGKGSWTYDLGQNFSGIVRVRLSGKKGQTVTLRPGELQNQDMTVNQSASGEPFFFRYTAKDGQNEWQPQFSYYGFRYVQVEGAVPAGQANPDSLPVIERLEGLHTTNAAPEMGTFLCSKPMFNKIYTLIDWAIRSNFASVITDCPHREKLGWQEQNHLMQYSIQYRYSLHSLYTKVMGDLSASQREEGIIPTIAPEYVRFADGFEDTPEWGSSFIISPWYIYKWYGDRRLIEQNYPAMKRYVNYLTSRANNHIVAYGLGDWYDIGPNRPGYAQLTSNGLTATAIYYYDVLLMQQMATLIGEDADAKEYADLAAKIKQVYNATFYHADKGMYDRNSQTANAISLFMGLVDEGNEEKVLRSLVDDIRSRNNALTAGDVGYRYLLRALEAGGESELIYTMNSKYDVPGYGWQLAHGATALTESWQAYGNVSNNHLMLGHLMEWLFSGLGGLRQTDASVAFREVLIDPQLVGDVTFATTTYESPYGHILCDWRKQDGRYTLKVEIPANSTAIVCLPTADADRITDYGIPLRQCSDITLVESSNGKSKWRVGAGTYMFEVR